MQGRETRPLRRCPNTFGPFCEMLMKIDISPEEKYSFFLTKPQTNQEPHMSADPSNLLPIAEPTQILFKGHEAWVTCVSISPNGEWIASGSKDGAIKLWNPLTGTCLRTFKGYKDCIVSLSFSSNSQLIAVCYRDGTVELWNTNVHGWFENRRARTWINKKDRKPFYSNHCIRFSPDGTKIAVSDNLKKTVQILDTKRGRCSLELAGHSSIVSSLAFFPDGNHLISGSYDGSIKIWKLHNGACLRSFVPNGRRIGSLDISPDGELIVFCENSTIITILKKETGELEKRIESTGRADKRVLSVVFSPDKKWLVSSKEDGTITIWKRKNWQPTRNYQEMRTPITSMAFSPNGRYLVFNTFISSLDPDYQKYRETEEQKFRFALLDFGHPHLGCVHPIEALFAAI